MSRVGTGVKLLSVLALLVAVLGMPALASAQATATTDIEIGPIRAAHGYSFVAAVHACGQAGSQAALDYTKGPQANFVDYDYAGSASCTARPDLRHGTLLFSWPGIATVKLTVAAAGRQTAEPSAQGCAGGSGVSRTVVLTGTFDIAASRYFGSLRTRRITARLERGTAPRCRAVTLAKSTDLSASFGRNLFVDASRSPHTSEVFVDDLFTPATGVKGSFSVSLTGTATLFDVNPTSATLTSMTPLASGQLVATKLAPCIGSPAAPVNATLSGTLTIPSPVLGPITLGPDKASAANIGPGDSSSVPGACNGYGSRPLTDPSVSTSCDDSRAPCSIMDGENEVDFSDMSSDGTQTVVSETIDYGDGSRGTFRHGQASHRYASPGTYHATTIIRTSDGRSYTAMSTVYISS